MKLNADIEKEAVTQVPAQRTATADSQQLEDTLSARLNQDIREVAEALRELYALPNYWKDEPKEIPCP